MSKKRTLSEVAALLGTFIEAHATDTPVLVTVRDGTVESATLAPTDPPHAPDDVKVSDALDFFAGQTVAQLVAASGAPERAVRRVLRECEERGTVERRGNKYRIQHAGPWAGDREGS